VDFVRVGFSAIRCGDDSAKPFKGTKGRTRTRSFLTMDCEQRQRLQKEYAAAVDAFGKAARDARRVRAFGPKRARTMIHEASTACQTALRQFVDHLSTHGCPAPRRYPLRAITATQSAATSIDLSYDAILVFVLWNGCGGRLRHGRVERKGHTHLDVYSPRRETLNDYVSGSKLRSWCIITMEGEPIGDWFSIAPEDHAKLRFPIR